MTYLNKTTIPLAAIALCGLGAALPTEKAGDPTVVYIVRHAEKKTGKQLSEEERQDNRKVDLLAEGYARAETLAWMLRDIKFDGVYSTDYKRTRMTIKPAADQAKLPIQKLDAKMRGTADLIRANDQAGKTLLICGHSDTIPGLLKELGVGVPEKDLKGYDDLFVVILGREGDGAVGSVKLQRVHYPGRHQTATRP